MNLSELKKLVNNIQDEAVLTNWTLNIGPQTTRQLHLEWLQPPRKKGYCERTKELLLEANPQYKTWDDCPYIIIDYPVKETVSVLIPFRRGIHISPDNLRKHKAELRLIKPVKNGTIIAYHFND